MARIESPAARTRRAAVCALAAAAAIVAAAPAAHAASTFTVNTNSDDATATCAAADPCSLRGAIAAANAEPGSTILLPDGPTHILTNGPLEITADGTRILGQGIPKIVVASGRAVLVRAGNVQLDNVGILGGGGGSRVPVGDGALGFDAGPGQTLSLSNVTIYGGNAHDGGAIEQTGGILGIADSLIHGNFADRGGAISVTGGGVTLIDGSTLHGNTARASAGLARGGAVVADDATVVALNSTFYGNTAVNGTGAALSLSNGSHLTLANVTIAGATTAAHVAARNASGVAATNTVIGDNRQGPACDLAGAAILDDHVVAGDDTCGLDPAHGSIEGLSPLFLPFGDYGAGVPVVPFEPTSILVDGGNSDPAVCPAIDQFYVPRPQGDGCDVGALESPYSRSGTPVDPGGPAPAGGGGGAGAGGAAGAKSTDPAGATDPAPTPAPPPVAPPASSDSSRASTARTPTVRLTRDGRLTVLAALPATPRGKVTLRWTVRKAKRLHRGQVQVTSANGALTATIVLPRRLKGARLVGVTAVYATANGKTRRTAL